MTPHSGVSAVKRSSTFPVRSIVFSTMRPCVRQGVRSRWSRALRAIGRASLAGRTESGEFRQTDSDHTFSIGFAHRSGRCFPNERQHSMIEGRRCDAELRQDVLVAVIKRCPSSHKREHATAFSKLVRVDVCRSFRFWRFLDHRRSASSKPRSNRWRTVPR